MREVQYPKPWNLRLMLVQVAVFDSGQCMKLGLCLRDFLLLYLQ